jgi:beta-1,3-galactosyltransferase 1
MPLQSLLDSGRIRLLFVIHSAPGNRDKRLILRQSWMRRLDHSTKALFFIGRSRMNEDLNRKVIKEAQLMDDIVLMDFVDSYANLTIKSVLMLKFLYHANFHTKYIVKVSINNDGV